MSERSFVVRVRCPDEVNATEIKRYIRDALECWRKGGNPEDPLFDVSKLVISVK